MERTYKVDEVTNNNGIPDTTPAQLLAEKPTPDDCRAVERVMGRFNSTTAFLGALKQVLLDLDSFEESSLTNTFQLRMAEVESKAMNGGGELLLQNPINEDEIRFSRVVDGELLNAGQRSTLEQFHDYLGTPPSPNGE